MLINNQHNSPLQLQHPRILQQHQHPVRQITPNHQHVIHFKKNPYTFEERYSLLSEPLEPVVRHAPLSEPQNKPMYKIDPSLQQDLNRTRHPSQTQKTFTIDRQIKHPRRNKKFTTPRVFFNIPPSPIHNPLDLSSSTIRSTSPPLQSNSKQNTPNIP